MTEPERDADPLPLWQSPRGEVIACVEKLKVLRINLEEIRQVVQDALDDAVLVGCDPTQYRAAIVNLVRDIESAYANRDEAAPRRKTST